MNPNAQFERDLEQWLRTKAPASAPAGFHASVMDRARTLRQRPGWARSLPARRFGRGRGMTLLAAAALLLVGGALAAGSGFLRLPSVVPPAPAPSFGQVATASPDATTVPSPSESAGASMSSIPAARPTGTWVATGSMGTPRRDHTAVRLLDGRVLVVGGDPTGTSAELYDPHTGTWSSTESMNRPRDGFSAMLLGDGRVLVGDVAEPDAACALRCGGAEVYDPETGTWTATGRMVYGGGGLSTATLLRDGRVLVVGYGPGAELYDPQTGAWTATGRMIDPRHSQAAVLLADGRVLVAGGHAPGDNPTASAELYDPQTDTWTATTRMHSRREGIQAFLQPDGKVLVVGGPYRGHTNGELYDPAAESWTQIPAVARIRGGETLAALADGGVLMTGAGDAFDAAEVFDPGAATWTAVGPMLAPHRAPATLLLDGTVLVAGGNQCLEGVDEVCVPTAAAELYVPAGVSPPPLPAFPNPAPPVFPSPTPRPTPLPPAAGPVPPNAQSWTVTVENRSSAPATLFVAEEGEGGILRLVGSASPNVVPAGATANVTFRFPAGGGWIYVNPRPGEGGSLVGMGDIGIPGRIVVGQEGDAGWLSP